MSARPWIIKALFFGVVSFGLLGCSAPEKGAGATPAAAEHDQIAGPAGLGTTIPEDALKVPDMAQIYPGMPDTLGDACWYLPYVVTNEEQGIAMLDALRGLLEQGKPYPDRLTVTDGKGAGGSNILYPLGEGVERFYIRDVNDPAETAASTSMMPVIIAQPAPDAIEADVLFLDGHVEAVHLGHFPLSPGFLKALSALDPPEYAEKVAVPPASQ